MEEKNKINPIINKINITNAFPKLRPKGSIYISRQNKQLEKNEASDEIFSHSMTEKRNSVDFLSRIKFFEPKKLNTIKNIKENNNINK